MRCTGSLVRSALLLSAPIGALGLGAATAGATRLSTPPASVDLLLDAKSQIDGPETGSSSGRSAAVADVNGDGRPDVIVSTDRSGTSTTRHTVRVLFGDLPSLLDLAKRVNGFTIKGALLDGALANAGDVNGDGRDDLIVTSTSTKRAYVVFGRSETTPVDVGDLGTGGYTIALSPTKYRPAVAGAGDVNGDGLGDIVIADTAAAWLVFGQASSTALDLSALGAAGYPVRIPSLGDSSLGVEAVAGAGDVNGDGRADVLIGAQYFVASVGRYSGTAWVVFGKANTTPVDAGALGSAGYTIESAVEGDFFAGAVANAGDANGDGVPDQIVGAARAGGAESGTAHVVFGSRTSTATVVAGAPGARGYAIEGADLQESVGTGLAGGVDLNRDGLDDQVIGAPSSGEGGRVQQGAAYVVYGKRSPGTVHLGSYKRGYRIDGPSSNAFAGSFVALTPRRSGHQPEVVVNAPYASANGRATSGSTYIVSAVPTATPVLDQVTVNRVDRVDNASGTRFALRYHVRRRARIEATVLQVVTGRRPVRPGSRCLVGAAAPPTGPRCVVHRRLQRLTRLHALSSVVSVPVPRALRRGRYIVRLTGIDARGRRFGPFRATIVVPGRR